VNRREFIAGLGSAAAIVGPQIVFAQKTGEAPRIAAIGVEPEPKAIAAFEQGMRAAGWVRDINMRLDYWWGRADPTQVVTEVLSWNPNVIAPWGSPNTHAAHQLTATIPIVFAVVSDPIGAGIVANLARPGGNLTGFSHFDIEIGSKWLQLLHEIRPQTTRVASMFNPALHIPFERSVEDAARSLGIEVTQAPVLSDDDIEAVFKRLAGEQNIALLVPSDAFTYVRSSMIADLAAKHRIPALYPVRRFVDDGGLIAYGPDLYDEIYRSASYVDRILKGEQPGDLPVQAPTKFEFLINLKAAKALGLEVPPSLLARADEVIE
jgi:putative ABC transport system substrate-binding protein